MIDVQAVSLERADRSVYQPTGRIAALVAMLLRAAHQVPMSLGLQPPTAPAAKPPAQAADAGEGDETGIAEVGWRYLHAVRGLDRLDTRAELALFATLRAPSSSAAERQRARDQLIEANLWVVPVIVRRYYRSGSGFDDLVAEGNIGLYKALERFDPSRGFRISTYAKWWVVDAVTTAMANTAYPVRVPRRVALDLSRQRRSDDDGVTHLADRDDDDTRDEIGTLGAPFDPGATAFVDEMLEDEDPQPDQVVAQRESFRLLATAIAHLPPRERLVIESRYGLNGRAERTLQQIGDEIGVTAERVRTLQLAAMELLRSELGANGQA
jgi:RNA polymerase sigma factor (sigma-70 family)